MQRKQEVAMSSTALESVTLYSRLEALPTKRNYFCLFSFQKQDSYVQRSYKHHNHKMWQKNLRLFI